MSIDRGIKSCCQCLWLWLNLVERNEPDNLRYRLAFFVVLNPSIIIVTGCWFLFIGEPKTSDYYFVECMGVALWLFVSLFCCQSVNKWFEKWTVYWILDCNAYLIYLDWIISTRFCRGLLIPLPLHQIICWSLESWRMVIELDDNQNWGL